MSLFRIGSIIIAKTTTKFSKTKNIIRFAIDLPRTDIKMKGKQLLLIHTLRGNTPTHNDNIENINEVAIHIM